MKPTQPSHKSVLVTGANGYIGNAVAKAFSRAGWRTYGLVRRQEDAADLAENEIVPIIGTPADLAFMGQLKGVQIDTLVSNTEDTSDPKRHFEKVRVMIDEITRRGSHTAQRPLVMFTSGCKDYGMMSLKDGDAGLAPHTELSPMNPPVQLAPRKDFGLSLLKASGTVYDATVLRPTIVYGHSSSNYGALFDRAASSSGTLRLQADPGAIMHSLHVDDCGDAYVALAEHPERDAVAGNAFNISNTHYETAQEIGEALAKCYGLDLELVAPVDVNPRSADGLANFWQWVGSSKLRELTGWSERRTSFVDGIGIYRLAYEAFASRRRGL